MEKRGLINRVEELISPVVASLGLECVEVEYTRGLLRVIVDKEGGITLEDCEKASRVLGPLLDVEDLIPHSYTLEVSSPGLDRVLKKREEFEKFKGRLVRIQTPQRVVEGRIIGLKGLEVELMGRGTDRINVSLSEITRAQLLVEF